MVMGRHIDNDARMIWLSLRSQATAMSAAQLTAYWSPTFSIHQVVDSLDRLLQGGYVRAFGRDHRALNYYVSAECFPLPGFAVAAVREPAGVPAP